MPLEVMAEATSMNMNNYVNIYRKYETVEDILREFYTLRLEYYDKRKRYLEGTLGAEAAKLSNQARFILEKCDGTVKVENKKKKVRFISVWLHRD